MSTSIHLHLVIHAWAIHISYTPAAGICPRHHVAQAWHKLLRDLDQFSDTDGGGGSKAPVVVASLHRTTAKKAKKQVQGTVGLWHGHMERWCRLAPTCHRNQGRNCGNKSP